MKKKRRSPWSIAVIFCMVLLLTADIILVVIAKQSNVDENSPGESGKITGGTAEDENQNGNSAGELSKTPIPQEPDKQDAYVNSGEEYEKELLAGMSLEQKVAQMFMITPEALTGYAKVTAAGEVTKQCFMQYPVGGIIYMAENLVDAEQTREMLSNMENYSMEFLKIPIFLGVDEEGGTVARIAKNKAFKIKDVGNMSEIGASGDYDRAYQAGSTIGHIWRIWGLILILHRLPMCGQIRKILW